MTPFNNFRAIFAFSCFVLIEISGEFALVFASSFDRWDIFVRFLFSRNLSFLFREVSTDNWGGV